MAESVNLKDTVNLPVTDFPMKGNLPEREPQFIADFDKKDIYGKIQKKNKGRPLFVMPDGPPYANGDIHPGHVLNKCLKDFVIKYKSMAGYSAAFIPGWDCHGLPIEHKVTKELGAKRKDKTDADIRQLCREEAAKWVDKQREQFKRLGILADWQNPYLTMQPQYEAEEVRELARALEKGIFYRGEKPVYWCPAMQTALADTEVEYAPHKSHSIYVKFDLTVNTAKKLGVDGKKASVVIWTTTPWTLPANLGVAFHPDFEYEFFESNGELLLIAKELKEYVEKDAGLTLTSTGKRVKGQQLDRMSAKHPFYDRESLFVLGDHVSLEAGTGAVHTAPGHGADDYKVGLKYGLKVYSPVDPAGRYTNEVPEYEGTKIWDANQLVVDRLKENSHLLGHKIIEHSYPHNWRSMTPLIFRATPQWFLAMDNERYNVREKARAALADIKFVPQWGEARLRAMIENRPDWTLSRQRIWGVPIPVFYCGKCEHALVSSQIMMKVADVMEKDGGIEAYHKHPVSDFIGNAKCEKCSSTNFRKSQDILDVWFDSGVCHAAVQDRREGLATPADIYLEGSDQHRGWFQTSLLSALATKGKAPFKALVTHGFVVDGKGLKMSKSKGNAIDPHDVIKKSGAEILRLWVSYEDYGQDIGFGQEALARVTETYRKFRNTMRFLLGNIGDFNPSKDLVDVSKMTTLDRYAMHQLNELIRKTTVAYDNYDFYKVHHALNNFFTVELSAGYLDMLKDRLYTWKKDGAERRSSQTVLYHMLDTLVRVMAPITTFLAEEVYSFMPGQKAESVFLLDYPKVNPKWDAADLAGEVDKLFEVRKDVSKILEDLRRDKTIGSGLDAKVVISADGEQQALLKKYQGLLTEFFIVSQVELQVGQYSVKAQKADGEKCERCWYYDVNTGKDPRWPTCCPKCLKALG